MANNNETLAAIIAEKLKEKGILLSDDSTFVSELAQGKLKETHWKITIEEVINSIESTHKTIESENETE